MQYNLTGLRGKSTEQLTKGKRNIRVIYERDANGHAELTLRRKWTAANPRDEEIV